MSDPIDSQQAEHLFHALFDNAPIGAAVIAPDGSWRRINTALAVMLGYSVRSCRPPRSGRLRTLTISWTRAPAFAACSPANRRSWPSTSV